MDDSPVDAVLAPNVAGILVVVGVVAVERSVVLDAPLDSCMDEASVVLVELATPLEELRLDEPGEFELNGIDPVELEISPMVNVGVAESEVTSLVVGVILGETLVVTMSELDVASELVITVELAVPSTNATPNSAIAAPSGA